MQEQVKAGYGVNTHTHRGGYEHTITVSSGRVRVKHAELTREYTAPASVTHRAGLALQLVALEDSVIDFGHAEILAP